MHVGGWLDKTSLSCKVTIIALAARKRSGTLCAELNLSVFQQYRKLEQESPSTKQDAFRAQSEAYYLCAMARPVH